MNPARGVLIVEDRAIVAGKVKRELERAGFVVAGMAASQEAAVGMAERLPLLAAVLDVDLRGQPVFPVAQALRRRSVPFIFVTGYGAAALPHEWRGVHLVEKPFEPGGLIRCLGLAIEGRPAAAPADRVTTPAIRRAWDRMRQTRDLLTEQRAWAEEHGFTKAPAD